MAPARRDFIAGLAGGALAIAGPPLVGQPGKKVQTVRGPIDSARLGFTLPHEHMFASSAGFIQTWPEYFGGRTAFVQTVVAKLKALKASGVDTIVDVTPADLGRDVRFLEAVSRRSGVQIITCTGHWLNPSLSMAARSADELAEFFRLEIERGIEGTGIRPGVIKVATEREVTPFLDRLLRGAARASKATGVPVTTHSYAAGRGGDKQAEIFESEGLSPSKVCIGHSDETNDLDYLTGLARRGYSLGMDHHPTAARGIPGLLTWQQRAECVAKLVEAGLADRLLLSNDWYFGLSMAPTGALQTLEKQAPDGMFFLTRKTIPYLRELGVSDPQIRTMTVDNPRRFFAGD